MHAASSVKGSPLPFVPRSDSTTRSDAFVQVHTEPALDTSSKQCSRCQTLPKGEGKSLDWWGKSCSQPPAASCQSLHQSVQNIWVRPLVGGRKAVHPGLVLWEVGTREVAGGREGVAAATTAHESLCRAAGPGSRSQLQHLARCLAASAKGEISGTGSEGADRCPALLSAPARSRGSRPDIPSAV